MPSRTRTENIAPYYGGQMDDSELREHRVAQPGIHDAFRPNDPDSIAHVLSQHRDAADGTELPGTVRSRVRLREGAGLTQHQLAAGMAAASGAPIGHGYIEALEQNGFTASQWSSETTMLTAHRYMLAFQAAVKAGRVPLKAPEPEPEHVTPPEMGEPDDVLEGNVPTVKAKRQRVPETTEQVRERVAKAKAKAEAALATGDGF
jgi:hypothetical protein